MNSKWIFSAASLIVPCLCWSARAESDLRAYYNDDFILETADGDFQLRIRGNLHLDGRLYQSEERGAPHSIDIRRARIDLQGRLHKWFTFRLQPEFAGQPHIRNAWVDAEVKPWLHVRAGQMKVPFSSSWVTLDNNVNFVEHATSTPIYPFFDRGVLVWGEIWDSALVYNLGAFTGVGMDIDNPAGDQDDPKDLAGRLFLQPFKNLEWKAAQGIFLVGQGTWGVMSTPTSRFETGGLGSANYETALWRWRTEQVIGTDGRMTDQVRATVDSKWRWGAELHYVFRQFSLSIEYLELKYEGIRLRHNLYAGSSQVAQEHLFEADGWVRSGSAWVSIYLTGESKILTDAGWKTPKPHKNLGDGGYGAFEVLLRYSLTDTDTRLFRKQKVAGFSTDNGALPEDFKGPTPGAGNSVSVSVLDGANRVHEATLGLCWTLNPMVRIQVDDVFLWAPEMDRDGDGENDNLLVSGAKSNQSNPNKKNLGSPWENAVMARLILKI